MAADHSEDVFHHVRDAVVFEVPKFLGGEWHIPQPFGADRFVLTKFMLLEAVAVLFAVVVFRGLASRVATGEPVRGRFWNFWEAILLYLRDELVRPLIGGGHAHEEQHGSHHNGHGQAPAHGNGSQANAAHASHAHSAPPNAAAALVRAHPADQYLPFIWSLFFFILLNNLLGAIPWLGSPTGSIWMTGALALFTFGYVVRVGMTEVGPLGFWKGLVPQIELSGAMKFFIIPLLWFIEFVGLLIKHGVLAVRLFANIMAGHTVIAVMLGFIGMASGGLFWLIAPASVLGQVGIGLLELFVAFLQAYVFAFLATLFIGSAVHPH
jgi:F-type H+-transporting ATPase subunit a